MAHKFNLGQTVGYHGAATAVTKFVVVQLLPAEDFMPEPRNKIKGEGESFERAAWERELTFDIPVSAPERVSKGRARLRVGGRQIT
jgi:hypothetical protein